MKTFKQFITIINEGDMASHPAGEDLMKNHLFKKTQMGYGHRVGVPHMKVHDVLKSHGFHEITHYASDGKPFSPAHRGTVYEKSSSYHTQKAHVHKEGGNVTHVSFSSHTAD